jgi:DNA-binding response OmpR family regulator
MEAGADVHLAKPLDEDALLREIERLLDRAGAVSGVRSVRNGAPVESSRKATR